MQTIPAKTIVTKNKSNVWFGADYNMNIYKGCCHGCIYCDSRSQCYGVEDFDTVRVKREALDIIKDQLKRKKSSGVIATGAMSDPYNPFEQDLQLTRGALELIDTYRFGVAIATKSELIARDIDLLRSIVAHSPVICKMTITTCDDALCQKIGPHVTSASGRFSTLEQLARAGIFCGILLMPVLPFLEDSEQNILGIVKRAQQSGAKFIYPSFGVTLRQNQREWYFQKLDELFPQQDLRRRYLQAYGNSYVCKSPRSKSLWVMFTAACKQAGILYQMRDIITAYQSGYQTQQLTLF